MRDLRLQPSSVLIGALACSLLVTVLAFRAPAPPERSLLVHTAPLPADHVRIVEGTPFEVPEGKTLTLKLLNNAGAFAGTGIQIQVDGMPLYNGNFFGETEEIPFGVTAFPGEVVTLGVGFPQPGSVAIAFGYLADARTGR
jgi:hypothetical protein